jgi:hypothetical protein
VFDEEMRENGGAIQGEIRRTFVLEVRDLQKLLRRHRRKTGYSRKSRKGKEVEFKMKIYQRLKSNARKNLKKNPLGFMIGVAAVLWGVVYLIVQIVIWTA